MQKNIFKNKKILITGCTGFTGGWLILYFKLMGAIIYGYSKKPPFKNSLFQTLNLKKKIYFQEGDVLDDDNLRKFYKKSNPDFVFHLAANAIVKDCYKYPADAFQSNTIGTLNLMEIIRTSKTKKKISVNIITTDKVYQNSETKKYFTEDDILGGEDPYSASKVCAEIICLSYYKSFLKNKNISINILRSGNIIGGGDWSNYRLIPDIANSLKTKKILKIRNPNHTRPWQHIFDVINSYALIASKKYTLQKFNFEIWNIGPLTKKNYSVKNIIKMIEKKITKKIVIKLIKSKNVEKKFLNLNSTKLFKKLNIKNKLNTAESIDLTFDWYLKSFKTKKDNFSENQLSKYLDYR